MNVNAHLKGSRCVTISGWRGRRLRPDFPGWDADGDYFIDGNDLISGTITDVESHGMSPFTRYSVTFDDGSTASGLSGDTDIAIARS